MRESLYTKLAKSSIRREKKLYLPFTFMGAVFLILMILMESIALEDALSSMSGMVTMAIILQMGVIVVGIFAVIALTSGYRFIRKERSEEEGLLMVLGMERKQLRRVERKELAYLFAFSSLFGIFLGTVLYRLSLGIFLTMMKIETNVIEGRILPNPAGIVIPLVAYFIIFFILYISSARKRSIADEMRERRAGEREGRFPVLKGILGVVLIAVGYWISLSVPNPVEAIEKFFVAVILVIVGTYLAIAFLVSLIVKLLKGKKSFYLQPKNFAAIAGLDYRVRYGARSLAAIAILSTCFVVVFMSGLSLFIGGKSLIDAIIPSDLQLEVSDDPQAEAHIEEAREAFQKLYPNLKGIKTETISAFVGEDGRIEKMTFAGDKGKTTYLSFHLTEDAPDFRDDDLLLVGRGEASDVALNGQSYISGHALEYRVPVGDVAVYTVGQDQRRDYLVRDKETFEKIKRAIKEQSPESAHIVALSYRKPAGSNMSLSYDRIVDELSFQPDIASKEELMGEFNRIYGAIFFTGICLSAAFLFFTGFSIYNKQLTEGHADKERFKILRDLGMTRSEAERVIATQIRTVFMIPIIFCTLHVTFAYPIVEKLLRLVGLNDKRLLILCILGSLVFYYLFYFLVYKKTSGTYRELVLDER